MKNDIKIMGFNKSVLLFILGLLLFIAPALFAQTVQTYTNTSSTTWTAPCGVTTITVECYGGGAGGASNNGGGGGGGAYSSSTLTVTPGTIYTISVGAGGSAGGGSTCSGTSSCAAGGLGGDTWFSLNGVKPTSSSTGVLAKGGNGNNCSQNSTGYNTVTGGSSAGGYGTIKYSGGSGAAACSSCGTNGTSSGGGGGAAAGSLGNGASGTNGGSNSGGAGGTGTGGGGNGGTGGIPNNCGTSGIVPGGGGGGGGYNSSPSYGGSGANGQVKISYPVVPSVSLTSAAGTTAQSVCANSAITTITYSITGSTSVSVTTLPTGVTGTYSSGVFTISGTPTVAGSYNYTVSTTGTCAGSSATGTMTVNPVPVLTNTNSATICTGFALNIPLTSTLSSSYTWLASNNINISGESTSLQSTNTINDVITNNATSNQTVTYTVTATSGSCSGTQQVTVTVLAQPTSAAVQASNNSTILNTEVLTLTGAGVGGSATTGAWSITSPANTGTLSSTAYTSSPDQVTYTPPANYSGTVILTLTTNTVSPNGCSASDTRTVTVISSSTTVSTATTTTWVAPCQTATVTVECWGAGGGGGRNASDGGGGGGGGAYSKKNAFVTSSNATYTITVGAGGSGATSSAYGGTGGSSWFSSSTVVLAKGGAGGAGGAASPGTGGLGGASTAGTGDVKYSGGNGANYNGSSNDSGGGGGSSAGTAAVGTYTTVTTTTVGATAPAGGGNGANGATSGTGSSATSIGGGGGGGYKNSNGGSGADGKVTVTITNLLHPGANVGAAQAICEGVATSFTFTVTNYDSYSVSTNDGTGTLTPVSTVTVSPMQSSSTATATYIPSSSDAARGVIHIIVTASNNCGDNVSSTKTFSVSALPLATATNSSQTICSGNAFTTMVMSTSNSVTGTTYTWTRDNTSAITGLASSGSGNITGATLTTTTTAAVTTTFTIIPTGPSPTSCAGSPIYATIVVNPTAPATPGAISGTANTFPGYIMTYSIAAVPNATSYTWAVPTGWSISSGQGTMTMTVTAGNAGDNGNITVTAANSCTTSAAQTLSVTVQADVAANQTPCQGTSEEYDVLNVPGSTYTWSVPSDWVITSGQGTNKITTTVGSASGTISVTASEAGSCTSDAQTLVVTPSTNPAISLTSASGTDAQSKCMNTAITSITYTVSGTGVSASASGLPSGVSGSYSSGVFTISGTPSAAGTFNYTVTATATCTQTSVTGSITVNTLPTVNVTSATICSGQNTTLTASGASAYTWSANAGGVTTSTVSVSPTSTTSYTVTGTTSGCSSSTVSAVTVNENAAINLTSAGSTTSQTICRNAAITAITYSLSGGATGAGASGLPTGVSGSYSGGVFTISGTPSVAGTYNYTVTTTGSCTQTSATGVITVNPNAIISLTSGSGTNAQSRCINSAITTITYSISGGATTATVTGLPAGVTGSFSGAVLSISGTPSVAGTFVYHVNTSGSCTQTSAAGSINVMQSTGSVSYWSGGTSNDWSDATNWCGNLPSTVISAVIPTGVPNYPVVRLDGAICKDLTLNSGASLTMNTIYMLGVYGNWTNNGTFVTGNSTIRFLGSTNQTINSSGTQSFYNLTINNTSASDSIILNTPVTVTNKLTLTKGIVISSATNMLTLTRGDTVATDGGDSVSFVDGPLSWKNLNGAGPFVFPTGAGTSKWARVALSSVTGPADFTCQYFDSSYTNVSTSDISTSSTYSLTNVSNKEYWAVSPTTPSVSAAVTLYWEHSDSSKINSCAQDGPLKVAHYHGSAWENANSSGTVAVTGTCSGNGKGTITSDVMSSFSPYTFGSGAGGSGGGGGGGINPLPIELLSFTAKYNGASVDVTWKTASEINNDYFTVERSVDGINFIVVGVVPSKALNGNSISLLNYTLNDPNNTVGTYYYRLKQTDYDGKYAYSAMVTVKISKTNLDELSFTIAPNPNDGKGFTLYITSDNDDNIAFVIHDMLGKLIHAEQFEIVNASTVSVPVYFDDALAAGVYIVTLVEESTGRSFNKKLVVR